ncbi:hypothetical protein [Pseudoxanthomonas sacheonensis]|uniref:hypothetical protein n=1 Tax=Pseudoxanthomonas sacheonensis TaxID=443615 RepID=UPI0013D0E550|nr:hypothetical protein [Pseudoxanthomonas sacheonensis]KAF1707763.1 hypothetical protein CSC73_10590 [Pseudoxanthomonas sacheonensis]
MKANDVIDMLETSFLEAKDMGLESLSLATLEEVIFRAREIAKDTPDDLGRYEVALESYRYRLANITGKYNNRRESQRDMTNHTINTGANALKASTLINGGAAVALLAFTGQVQATAGNAGLLLSFSLALGFFAAGVFLAALATGATYVSQAAFGKEFAAWNNKAGVKWRGVAIGGVFLSFVMFVVGGAVCASALSGLSKEAAKKPEQISVPHSVPAKRPPAKVA